MTHVPFDLRFCVSRHFISFFLVSLVFQEYLVRTWKSKKMVWHYNFQASNLHYYLPFSWIFSFLWRPASLISACLFRSLSLAAFFCLVASLILKVKNAVKGFLRILPILAPTTANKYFWIGCTFFLPNMMKPTMNNAWSEVLIAVALNGMSFFRHRWRSIELSLFRSQK